MKNGKDSTHLIKSLIKRIDLIKNLGRPQQAGEILLSLKDNNAITSAEFNAVYDEVFMVRNGIYNSQS